MTMKGSPKPNSSSPSPRRYLKPGALAKLRDSKKIKASRKLQNQINLLDLSQLSPTSSPSSPPQQNLDNVVPCFNPTINRPRCLARKKLFAVTPVFTEHTDTYMV
ncbi:hypothetical protein MtrunA17_Chr8g0362551 [Medicago truncatula]|uniref:Uncharacterized protein n=1 Tax=Medicago truncatula TaxID=3880 RepID=A0A072TRJ5_MEDTR|nr:hypothetical protein MTR_8g468960 [Medicago truncatula]RHN41110.1 hypothetical protein MtrunA17_Chr8g0362551 [Medicago truncatula]